MSKDKNKVRNCERDGHDFYHIEIKSKHVANQYRIFTQCRKCGRVDGDTRDV